MACGCCCTKKKGLTAITVYGLAAMAIIPEEDLTMGAYFLCCD